MKQRSRDDVRGWYICTTTKNHELKVRDTLSALIEHDHWKNYIFDIFVPTVFTRDAKGKLKEQVMDDAYKTYIYIEMILTDDVYDLIKIDGFRHPMPPSDPIPLSKRKVEAVMALREKLNEQNKEV